MILFSFLENNMNSEPSVKDFIQKRLDFFLQDHPYTNRYHLFKDKLREKLAVSQMGCSTAEIYKIFESPEEIELSGVPDSFVIKLSYQSRSRGILRVKNGINLSTGRAFNLAEAKNFISNYYYPDIKHQKVLVEELLLPEEPGSLLDIKVFFLKGEPIFLQWIDPKERPENRIYPRYHFSPNWERMNIHKQEAPLEEVKDTPKCFAEILDWGRKISAKYFSNTFVRIDFYPTDRGCVFGETTICPNFDCKDWVDKKYGEIFFRENIDI